MPTGIVVIFGRLVFKSLATSLHYAELRLIFIYLFLYYLLCWQKAAPSTVVGVAVNFDTAPQKK